MANLLRRRLSQRQSTFQLGGSLAILPSIGGGSAAYLGNVCYIQLPFGIISPGSTVLFSGKLLIILMLYIKEDAEVVRQPIYGLLFGNFLIVALVFLLQFHEVLPVIAGKEPDLAFVRDMGACRCRRSRPDHAAPAHS